MRESTHTLAAREREVPVTAALVSLIDSERRFIRVDAALAAFAGYSPRELCGTYQDVLLHPDTPRAVLADMWAALGGGRPWTGVLKHIARGGDHFWLALSIVPVRAGAHSAHYKCVGTRASRQHIEDAEQAYKALRKDGTTIAFINGQVVNARPWARWCRAVARRSMVEKLGIGLLGTAIVALVLALGTGRSVPLAAAYAGLFCCVGVAAAAAIGRCRSRDVDTACAVIEAMAEGNFHQRIGCERNDEMGRLFQSLKILQVRLGFPAPRPLDEGACASRDMLAAHASGYANPGAGGCIRRKADTGWPVAGADALRKFELIAFRTRLLALNLALREGGDAQQPDAREREARELAVLACEAADGLRERVRVLSPAAGGADAARAGRPPAASVITDVSRATALPHERVGEVEAPPGDASAGGNEAYDARALNRAPDTLALGAGRVRPGRRGAGRAAGREAGSPLPKIGTRRALRNALRDEWEKDQ